MFRHGALAILGLFAALSAASAQGEHRPATGTVRGVVINDSTRRPIPWRAVTIDDAVQRYTSTDTLGRFELRELPSGRVEVRALDGGFRRFAPVPVAIVPDSVVDVMLRLRAEYLVADCAEVARCAALLAPRAGVTASLSDTEQLEEAAWRTALALARWDSTVRWVPCAEVRDASVLRALRSRVPTRCPRRSAASRSRRP